VIPGTLLRAGLRDLVRRPLHTGLLVVGVALGVAVVVAIDLAAGAARLAFARSAQAVTGRATHQVRGGPAGLPEDLYRQLRVEHGLRPSAPVVEGVVLARDLDARRQVAGRRPLHRPGDGPQRRRQGARQEVCEQDGHDDRGGEDEDDHANEGRIDRPGARDLRREQDDTESGERQDRADHEAEGEPGPE